MSPLVACFDLDRSGRPGAAAPAEVARAARFYIDAQVETGHLCPITMTRAALAALAAEPALAAQVAAESASPALRSLAFAPWWEKSGMTLGMGMTEKQGGTDVRANTTSARCRRASGLCDHRTQMVHVGADERRLPGAGASPRRTDLFFDAALSPRRRGQRLRLQRLKDKLGNRSNASSEVEFADAFAWRVGEEGAGIRTILQMVQLTRLDCAIASAGLDAYGAGAGGASCARTQRVREASSTEQPMMRAVLADLALDVEAAVALVFRLARALDQAAADPREAAYARLMTPAAKFLVCKLAPASSTRRWNASAATAMSRRACCRGFTARRRSMRSGKAPAMSWASTCCARSRDGRRRDFDVAIAWNIVC